MTRFPEPPKDDYALVFLSDTDQPLPESINPGTLYAYFKTIARGGKCIIQSCKDLLLSRTICYKSLRPELADDAVEQQRFLREARVTSMLQHPNTVPVYELGRDSRKHYYFTMKLVHGYTLREVLDYRDRYDLTQLIDVVIQVAHALEFAHGHRVAHRDIKPENVLVGPFGEVLLLDWGLAKVWNSDGSAGDEPERRDGGPGGAGGMLQKPSSLTGQSKLQGTISYMSPEQILEDPEIDYRTDLYSIGVVLYEILGGRPPAVGETVREVMEQILEGKPAPPSTHTSVKIPALLEAVTMRCIATDPADRLQSAGDLVRQLQEDWLHS